MIPAHVAVEEVVPAAVVRGRSGCGLVVFLDVLVKVGELVLRAAAGVRGGGLVLEVGDGHQGYAVTLKFHRRLWRAQSR